MRALHKGAKSCYGLADDQVLHLIRALVGVERLGVSEEARDVIIDEDAVAAQQLSRPGDRLTRLGRRERLRKRRLLFRKLAFVCELGRANHHALAGSDVAEHLRKEVLNELERADRLSELQSLLCVLESVLVCAHLASRRFPSRVVPRPTQHARGVAEGLSAGREPICFRQPAVLHRDLAVLDDLQRNLVLHLLDAEPVRRLVLDDETLTWLSATSRAQMIEMSHHVALPIHRFWPLRIQVSPSRFAVVVRPPPVPEPTSGLGQPEAADLFHAGHRRQPLLFLLLRSNERDRTHRQAAVDAEEGRD